jgi:hypothetical protein
MRDAASDSKNMLTRNFTVSNDYCIATNLLDPKHKLGYYVVKDDAEQATKNYAMKVRQSVAPMIQTCDLNVFKYRLAERQHPGTNWKHI